MGRKVEVTVAIDRREEEWKQSTSDGVVMMVQMMPTSPCRHHSIDISFILHHESTFVLHPSGLTITAQPTISPCSMHMILGLREASERPMGSGKVCQRGKEREREHMWKEERYMTLSGKGCRRSNLSDMVSWIDARSRAL